MATKFTDEQRLAIDSLDKSILVSAAAGSGKTAVLVERIISIILEGRANVDEMLVVTFTNAAAAEMRLRLSSSIRKRMQEHPEEAPRLREQLSRLYRAYISTIDSFALRIIREFFYEIDIEPEFSICDDVQAELMKREAAAELFEEAFERDDIIEGGSFRAFLRLYSEERSDEGFAHDLIESYDKLRTLPSYFDWAFEKAENLKISKDGFEGSVIQDIMRQDALEVFENACRAARSIRDLMEASGLEDMYESKLKERCDAVFEIYAMLKEGRMDEALMSDISSIPTTRVAPSKIQKEAFEAIKDEIKAMRDVIKAETEAWQKRYLVPDFETRLAEMNATYEYTIYYLRLLQEFEKRYSEKKRERRLMDFSDTEHTAVQILQNDEAAEILRKRFRFVFVDEYQDTNNIQEYLISKVSSPRNVFKVGDVKQSIYKFRQAEPALFEELYAEYGSEENADGMVIDLSRNFRTNDATIRYINHVFEHVMDGYDERARLYTGTDCPKEYDFKPELHILLKEDVEQNFEGGADGGEFQPDAGDEIDELTNDEAECVYIAELAAGIIGREFYDTKAKTVRKAEARDIAILLKSVKFSGERISRALGRRNIEAHIEETDDFFDTIEINIALSLLCCIDNMKRDTPLISALHSQVFGFSPKELAEIRISYRKFEAESREETETVLGTGTVTEKGKEGATEAETATGTDIAIENNPTAEKEAKKNRRRSPYWKAFKWYAENGRDENLREKTSEALGRIMEWRRLSRIMPLSEFIWKVLVDSGYYIYVGAMRDGGRRQANLRALADRADRFSKDSVASLSSFITFVEVMKKKKISNGQPPMVGKDDDVVRISTMHKSKGLEFPFVIVGGLGRKFRRDYNEKKFSFDSKTGVGMPYIDPARRYWRSSIMQMAMNAKNARDSYREDLRLLYVDMTRARNKLYLVGTCKDEESLMKYGKPSDYLKLLKDYIKTGYCDYYIKPLDRSDSADNSSRRFAIGGKDLSLGVEAKAIYEEIDRRFSYSYPDEELLTAKPKYSVSELRRNAVLSAQDNDNSDVIQRQSAQQNDIATEIAFRNEGEANAATKNDIRNETAFHSDLIEEKEDITAPQTETEVVNLWDRSERRKRASATDIGIAYHRLMEFVDFEKVLVADGKPDMEYINERAEFLYAHEAIEEDVFRALDMKRVAAFFESNIGMRAVRAAEKGRLKKEKPFTLKTERDGREILVQGVIDCCFEEEGQMVLIDYKSSFVKLGLQHEEELARIRDEYKVQIELYSEAVRKGIGLDVSEAYLYLFATGEAIRI
ncbi:MAG: UvrD-helicase domain-containing protein [Mogibacterium sp.]|nr:UvrD-helicase domain-containing protein [Mogibacterium sp.]